MADNVNHPIHYEGNDISDVGFLILSSCGIITLNLFRPEHYCSLSGLNYPYIVMFRHRG